MYKEILICSKLKKYSYFNTLNKIFFHETEFSLSLICLSTLKTKLDVLKKLPTYLI